MRFHSWTRSARSSASSCSPPPEPSPSFISFISRSRRCSSFARSAALNVLPSAIVDLPAVWRGCHGGGRVASPVRPSPSLHPRSIRCDRLPPPQLRHRTSHQSLEATPHTRLAELGDLAAMPTSASWRMKPRMMTPLDERLQSSVPLPAILLATTLLANGGGYGKADPSPRKLGRRRGPLLEPDLGNCTLHPVPARRCQHVPCGPAPDR